MHTNNYILSPCGTSILTNQTLDKTERVLIYKHANKRIRSDIPHSERAALEALILNTARKISTANDQAAAKMSAELNGIIQIYRGAIPKNNDIHFLLSTDTWLGEETANLVKKWLESKNGKFIVQVHRHKDLQTADISAFQLSLSDLIKKLSEEIPGYSETGYKIIFNLTGGFKSVQGFLQSIANFYADETVYIFESSSELMRIPRLPIQMDALPIIKEHLSAFRALALGLPIADTGTIPETLLFKLDGESILSPWGELLWSTSRQALYGKKLLPPPLEMIRYAKVFMKRVNDLPCDRLALINQRIDQLSKYFKNPSNNPRSLDFKQLKGNSMKPSTHEMDAWADSDAKRIFGHFEGALFVLDTLDKGLH